MSVGEAVGGNVDDICSFKGFVDTERLSLRLSSFEIALRHYLLLVLSTRNIIFLEKRAFIFPQND